MTARRSADQVRKQRLAAIHIQAGKLQLDDDVYRDVLQRVTGHRSAKDCNAEQLQSVLAEFDRMAGKSRPARSTFPGRPTNMAQLPAMIEKVEALLASMKLPWSYADSIAMRQFKIARVAWCKKEEQLRAIIAALHVEQEKRGMGAQIDGYMVTLGLTDATLAEAFPVLVTRPKWRRDRTLLKAVAEALDARLQAKVDAEEAGAQ